MTDPFIGEIRINSFDFAPTGWASCDGQTMQISQNQALYSLIGGYATKTQTTFNLPDLRGRVPVAQTTSLGTLGTFTRYQMGATGGVESVSLTASQIPPHIHAVNVNNTANNLQMPPGGCVYANSNTAIFKNMAGQSTIPNQTTLHPNSVSTTGSGQPHTNMQPYISLNFCIALTGYYPSRQ